MKQSIIAIFLIVFSIGLLSAQKQSKEYHFKYKNSKYQLVDHNNKKVKVKPFTFASDFSEGLAVVEKDLKFGYIDSTGQTIIDYQFYDAGEFHAGLASASLGDKYGYINKKGEWVIKPQFHLAREFRGDFAKVLKENPDTAKYGKSFNVFAIINKKGEVLGNRYFSSIYKKKEKTVFTARTKDSVFHVSLNGEVRFHELKQRKKDTPGKDDIMPQFPGGERELRKYIATNVRYPISAQDYRLKSKCYISFVIDKEGNITEVYPAKLTFPVLMKEGVRSVSGMPKWKPGIQNGKPVKVSYTVPINFVLE